MSKLRSVFASPHFWPVVIICVVTLMAYWNSLSGEFVYDDQVVIVDRAEIRSLHSIPTLFKQSYWGPSRGSFGAYRPLTNVSFALNYVFSGLNPVGYHVVNLVLHGLNSILIYGLVIAYLRNWSIALITAVLFAVHPIHTEAVSAIAGRPEVLAATFCLSAWLAYRFRTESLRFYWYAVILYFLALFTKESSIALLGVLVLVDVYQFWPNEWRTQWKSLLAGYAGFFIPIGLYLSARILVLTEIGVTEDESFFKDAIWPTRLLTMSYGFVKMIQLLVWPAHLAADYDFSQIPLIHTLNLRSGLSLALVGGVLVGGVMLFRYEKITSFAIFFFFGTLFLVSNLVFPIGILIAERTLYFPSISVCLVAGVVLYRGMARGRGWRVLAIGVCLGLTIGGIIRTTLRNLDWRNRMSFGTAMIQDAPYNPKGYLVMGLYYLSQQRNAEAKAVLKKGIALDLTRVSLRNVLVDIYLREDRLEEAQAEITEILKINPHSPHGRRSLARLLARQNKDQAAAAMYRETMKGAPISADNHHEFAVLLSKTGDLNGAETEFLRAIELRPTFVDAYLNLGLTYRSLGKLDQSVLVLREGINLDPRNPIFHSILGQVLLRQKNLDAAIQELQLAIDLNPKCADCFNNLGVALAQQGRHPEALRAFEQAVALNPQNTGAIQNLERLRQQLNQPGQPSS